MDDISKTVKKHHDGAIINLFVTPGAQSTIFPAGYNKWRQCIEIKVNSPARDNKANKDVIKSIAKFTTRPNVIIAVINRFFYLNRFSYSSPRSKNITRMPNNSAKSCLTDFLAPVSL